MRPRLRLDKPLLCVLCGILSITALAALTASGASPSQQPLPTPFPEARYRDMSARSPFAVATAQAPAAAAPTPGFASQLYVDGVAQLGDTDYVAIKSRDPDKPAPLFLAVGESSPDGLKVERVNWSDEMGKSTVDVSKNGERATLIFDEAQIAKNGAAADGGQDHPVFNPGGVNPGGPMIRPPGYPFRSGWAGYNRFQLGNQAQLQNGAPLPGTIVRRYRGVIQAAPNPQY